MCMLQSPEQRFFEVAWWLVSSVARNELGTAYLPMWHVCKSWLRNVYIVWRIAFQNSIINAVAPFQFLVSDVINSEAVQCATE